MPPRQLASPGSPEDWLIHARSDLALAQIDRSPEILLENLCFHAQQAAEKAIKAVLVSQGVSFPPTHNVGILLELLPEKISVSQTVRQASELTEYAVASRYPGELEALEDETEYREAVRLAQTTVAWAEELI